MKKHPVGNLGSRFRDQRSTESSKVAAATIQLIFQLKSSSFWVTLPDIGQYRGRSVWRDENPWQHQGSYEGKGRQGQDLSNP